MGLPPPYPLRGARNSLLLVRASLPSKSKATPMKCYCLINIVCFFTITEVIKYCDEHPEGVDAHCLPPAGEYSREIGAAVELHCVPGYKGGSEGTLRVECTLQAEETGQWVTEDQCQGTSDSFPLPIWAASGPGRIQH